MGPGLEDILVSLGLWAARAPDQREAAPIGVDSIVLALKTLFDSDAAEGLHASYELRFGEDCFRVEVSGDEIAVARGGTDQADATIDTDADTLDAVLWGGLSLTEAQRSGDLRIEGDKSVVRQLVRIFPMPEPAAAGATP